MYRSALFVLCLISFLSGAKAQAQSENEAIKAVIQNMFDGMRASDSTMIRQSFGSSVTFQRVQEMPNGKVRIVNSEFEGFLKSIASAPKGALDEQIQFESIQIDGAMASVWTPFKFYLRGEFSHCGVNVFKLYRGDDGWKIFHLVDTNRKDNCTWK